MMEISNDIVDLRSESGELENFVEFSQAIGSDPLQIQGPGGNTSYKTGNRMWIKASGTQLSDAKNDNIFVQVDLDIVRQEANGANDGTCRAAVIDKNIELRPSIETTFHGVIDWPVVAHTHSISTIVHSISEQGIAVAAQKLSDQEVAIVPYATPGIELTNQIQKHINPNTQIIILRNHGLICCAKSVEETSKLIQLVEKRLKLPAKKLVDDNSHNFPTPDGYEWYAPLGMLAKDSVMYNAAISGTYYPDHVVFLGPALPIAPLDELSSAVVMQDQGVLISKQITPIQLIMLECLCNVLARLVPEWDCNKLPNEEIAKLLNWDAEKYRQEMLKRNKG